MKRKDFIYLKKEKPSCRKQIFCNHNWKRVQGTSIARCIKCRRAACVSMMDYPDDEQDMLSWKWL